ncbi:MAG: bifunctional 4-hydroxy-2-oxoglutarate aldolase/2-dehydro-3-deoxy-phosphogluconate aldolase [Clostridiales bacterium]|nr:bifunctional 4-hydroxy-2-oxoglutarate aldolase/2-dehydro-3-deoxy-phosphogluconate aldolase [Clostridiales bacterium]
MPDVKAEIFKEKLIIIARGVPARTLTDAAAALIGAGVRLLESTFDHTLKNPIADNAEKIAALRRAFGDRLLVGAGTVLCEDEAQAAFDAGATYVIAPNTNPRVVARAKKLGMLAIPGAYTPTEICAAWELGADFVKLFPADDAGLHYLQNIRAPLPHIPLMVTGGINPATIPPFLSAGVACVGTGVTVLRRDLLERGDFAGIATLAKMHVDAVRLAQA